MKTPAERAEELVMHHDITQMVGAKHHNPGRAKQLIADAITEAVAAERERCARVAQQVVDDIDPQGWYVAEQIRKGEPVKPDT